MYSILATIDFAADQMDAFMAASQKSELLKW